MDKFLEKFVKIPWQQKLLAVGVLLIVMVAGDYFVYISPATAEQLQLDNEEQPEGKKQKTKKKLLEKQQQASHLTEYKREVERLKQQVKEAQEQLPTQAEIPKLMRDVAYEGQQS